MSNPLDINWDKAPEDADCVIQGGASIVFSSTKSSLDDGWVLIATRPKKPLTDEQIQAVWEFAEWTGQKGTILEWVDDWLKQRGGEHE